MKCSERASLAKCSETNAHGHTYSHINIKNKDYKIRRVVTRMKASVDSFVLIKYLHNKIHAATFTSTFFLMFPSRRITEIKFEQCKDFL